MSDVACSLSFHDNSPQEGCSGTLLRLLLPRSVLRTTDAYAINLGESYPSRSLYSLKVSKLQPVALGEIRRQGIGALLNYFHSLLPVHLNLGIFFHILRANHIEEIPVLGIYANFPPLYLYPKFRDLTGRVILQFHVNMNGWWDTGPYKKLGTKPQQIVSQSSKCTSCGDNGPADCRPKAGRLSLV
jgi:hypothetical protein